VAIRATTGAALNARQWADRAWVHVYAAFDADAAGDWLAERVAAWGQAHGVPVHRVVPSGAKDWAAAWAAMVPRYTDRDSRDEVDHTDAEVEP